MFSKKTMVAAGVLILIALNVFVFSFTYIRKSTIGEAAARTVLFVVSPVQEKLSGAVSFMDGVWSHYFFLINVSNQNVRLRRELAAANEKNRYCQEIALANERLRAFVDLKEKSDNQFIPAEIIAKDPSPWYCSLVINRGSAVGVSKGLPVVAPEGVVGQVISASSGYARVLLITDRNSAVDALVQRTRARGIVRGKSNGACQFDYALRKQEIRVGDIIVSSGLDGIYPKGWSIGRVSKVIRRNSGLFQEIEITPFVDFKKLEELMVISNPPNPNDDVADSP